MRSALNQKVFDQCLVDVWRYKTLGLPRRPEIPGVPGGPGGPGGPGISTASELTK